MTIRGLIYLSLITMRAGSRPIPRHGIQCFEITDCDLNARQAMTTRIDLVALERISRTILVVRGQRVMLDRELAAIYGVTIKRLNEQVKRNAPRFPEDFVFQLTAEERECLRSQFATLKTGRGRHIK
jgi:hypothetical protein